MLTGLLTWFESLDATFTFLLLLPIAVAIAGLLAEAVRARSGARPPER